MKICLISFDYWDFDTNIVEELNRRTNIEAVHIDLFQKFEYTYPSYWHKLYNFFLKTFIGKNLKHIAKEKFPSKLVIESIKAMNPQDIILVIRPDVLDLKTHIEIKKHTKNYFAYLYDSTKRFPIDHLLNGVFDKIFSFDIEDAKKYNFIHLTNYIYLPKKEIQEKFEYGAFIVLSADQRIGTLNKIAAQLDKNNINYKFIVHALNKPHGLHSGIEYSKDEIRLQLPEYLEKSHVFVDLIRIGHNGLSFRVFEALAHQKKLITTNTSIKDYDFYNPDNILIIDKDNPVIPSTFFESKYTPLTDTLYNKYSLPSWINRVFFTDN